MGENDIVRVSCATENCGTFPMDRALNQRLRRTGNTFTCPAGHRQSYNAESTEKKLRERIGELKRELDRTEERLDNYKADHGRLWDDLREERDIRQALEASILADVDGVTEITEGRFKWACECGSKTTTTYDTEREAWEHYDRHRENVHDESEAVTA